MNGDGDREGMSRCPGCGSDLSVSHTFCSRCGLKVAETESERVYRFKTRFDRRLLVSLCTVVIYILFGGFVGGELGAFSNLAIDLLFLLLVVLLASYYREDLQGALRSYSPFQSRLFFYSGGQALLTTGVIFLVPLINGFLGVEQGEMVAPYRDTGNPLLFAFISIAILPPLTEELAFRGVLFGQLSKVTSIWTSILVSGFLFAWVHFSLISLLWLFPAGVFLGWVRYREASIWPCVFLHALHNGGVLFWEVWG